MSDTLYRTPALREYDLNATGSKLRPGISRKVRQPQPPLASHVHALNTPHTSRPSLFHIEGSTPSDADEDELENADEPGLNTYTFPERVMTAEPDAMEPNGEEAELLAERLKEDTRKYHALMELLTTEVGYVLDMRALVTVRQFLQRRPFRRSDRRYRSTCAIWPI